jgi:hypothetical protein
MKKSSKKSTVKSKSKIVQNPLKKYQAAGAAPFSVPPSTGFGSGNLGSGFGGTNPLGADNYLSTPASYDAAVSTFNSLYGGSNTNLTNVSDPSYSGRDSSLDTSLNAPRSLGEYYKDTQTASGDKSNKADILKSEYKTTPLSKQNSRLKKIKTVADSVAAVPFANIVGEGMKSTKVDDPNKFYNRGVREKLERYNKKIKGAKTTSAGLSTAATGLGTASGVMAATGVGLPIAAILGLASAAAGIGAGISSGVAGGYSNKQEQFATEYEEKVENRKSEILRTDEQRKKNAAMNAQQYYNVPTAKTGGLMRYMGGGYQKVTGPSHENGGIDMDLSGDGVNDAELEGGEIIEEMKHGGNAPKKYIWSDHLKTGGMSFAKKFEELRKGGARPGDVETLRIEQELAAKRDPSKLYAKYGGMHKYKNGGNLPKYQLAGPEVEPTVPTSWVEPAGPRQTAGPLAVASPGAVAASSTPSAKNQWLNAILASNRPAGTNPNLPTSSMAQYNTAPVQNQANLNTAPQKRVSRTGAEKFLAEYGAPMASLAGGIGDISMNLRQKYNPAKTVNARDVKYEQVFVDRAKDKRVGARESEFEQFWREGQKTTSFGGAHLNAGRIVSLRAQEEAAQNVYDINRQASSTERQLNRAAQERADGLNQNKDLVTSESRRNEGLRKESFENMRKKYIGSVVGELGNELASGMYKKEYIDATLPDGVDTYELRAGAIADMQQKINPATGKLYTLADANNAVLMQLEKERQAKAAKKAAEKAAEKET